MAGGYLNIGTREIENFPLPNITEETIHNLEKLVDEIITKKKQDKDTQILESQIDTKVYELYRLTEEEIKIVES